MSAVHIHIGLHTRQHEEAPAVGQVDMLDHEERQRLDQMHDPDARWSYQSAHVLLRQMLETHYRQPAASWRFTRGMHGKPEIDPFETMVMPAFSLSHTRHAVACALTGSAEDSHPVAGLQLGIDVESLDRKVDALRLARRFCATEEYAWLSGLPAAQQSAAFLRLWTLKEAVSKATGLGLQAGFQDFVCRPDTMTVTFAPESAFRNLHWYLYTMVLDERHCVSLAACACDAIQPLWLSKTPPVAQCRRFFPPEAGSVRPVSSMDFPDDGSSGAGAVSHPACSLILRSNRQNW